MKGPKRKKTGRVSVLMVGVQLGLGSMHLGVGCNLVRLGFEIFMDRLL